MTYAVEIDRAGCIGAGQCALYAPEVFQVRDGLAQVLRPEPGEDLHDAVLDAADACPVQAVIVSSLPPATA